jgi:hypothetical protein
MGARSRIRKLPLQVRRELELATAIAREAVFATHASRAEALILLAGDRVSAARMLQIHARLHLLSESDAHFLSNRVLADIGRRTAKQHAAAVVNAVDEDDSDDPAVQGSFFRRLRDRMRGRRLHELRRGVELYAGITEVALLKVHVKHAHRFVSILYPACSTVQEAIGTYREILDVRSSSGEVLYYLVLERMAAANPPAPWSAPAGAAEPAAEAGQRNATPARAAVSPPQAAPAARALSAG